MFKWLSWIRSYYLYGYYCFSWDAKRKEYDWIRGFIATVSLVMAGPAYAIVGVFNKWHFFMDDSMREHLFFLRGSVNYLILIGFFIACVLTYLVCCAGVKFKDIGPRLEKISYFSERSFLKVLVLWVLNLAFCFTVLDYFYK